MSPFSKTTGSHETWCVFREVRRSLRLVTRTHYKMLLLLFCLFVCFLLHLNKLFCVRFLREFYKNHIKLLGAKRNWRVAGSSGREVFILFYHFTLKKNVICLGHQVWFSN